MVDVHGLVHGMYMVDVLMLYMVCTSTYLVWYVGDFGTCLVEACVGDGGHLVERFPWYMIHVRGSSDRLVMEPTVDRGIKT
jgi:hypothetical protein